MAREYKVSFDDVKNALAETCREAGPGNQGLVMAGQLGLAFLERMEAFVEATDLLDGTLIWAFNEKVEPLIEFLKTVATRQEKTDWLNDPMFSEDLSRVPGRQSRGSYTPRDDAAIRRGITEGLNYKQIGLRLGRTQRSIQNHAYKILKITRHQSHSR